MERATTSSIHPTPETQSRSRKPTLTNHHP